MKTLLSTIIGIFISLTFATAFAESIPYKFTTVDIPIPGQSNRTAFPEDINESAVLGLVAAALGIRRDEEAVHQTMATSYGFAVRVEHAGSPIRDYHTAQVPPAGSGRRKKTFATRKDELAVPREDLRTILSSRDYRCDSLHTVCLWTVGDSSPYSLAQFKAAMAIRCA